MDVKVSIIIPAHNAAGTIEETLQSVLMQTFISWETVVVDDGSIDQTAEIVNSYLSKDNRFRYIKQEKSGVSAARNNGIENASGDWLLFLDSDDLIKPEMLEKMIKGADLHPECDMILCNWERLTVDGKTIPEIGPNWTVIDAFNLFAFTCAFCIHSCLVKKCSVLKVGKFDQTLITCEDWDLWQRIARTGARFTLIPDSLAVYRMRSASASNKGIQLFKDGLIVVSRGHCKDPRVQDPDEKYINGTPTPDLPTAILGLFTWSAGLMFGSGDDPSKLIEYMPDIEKISFDVPAFADDFFRAAILPTGSSFEIWEELYTKKFEVLKSFFQKLEVLSSAPEFVKRSLLSIERLFFNNTDISGPKRLGSCFGTMIDISKPINHLRINQTASRAVIKIIYKEKILGNIELPVIKGFIHKQVLKDAIAENYSWQILGEFFEKNIYKKLSLLRKIAVKIRSIQYKHDISKGSSGYFEKLHDFIGWTVFLQETFNRRYWVSLRFYKSARQLKPVRTVKQEFEHISVELGNEIPNIKLTKNKLTLIITAGGNACSKIEIPGEKKYLNAQEVRSIIIKELGYELCKIVVREILIGEGLKENISLNKLMRKKFLISSKKPANETEIFHSHDPWDEINKIVSEHEKGLIVPRRNSLFADDSSARFAMLPLISTLNLPEFFIRSGKEDSSSLNEGKGGYDLNPEEFDYTLYSPNVINTKSYLSSAGTQICTGNNSEKKLPKSGWNTRDLPVLMYHRIAPAGSDLMRQYRVAPSEFEKQIQHLADNGYYPVSFEEWYNSIKLNKPMPGKAVILTFDDGYLDFYQFAYPILEKFKFSAYVFIVSDYVGQSNVWDKSSGENLPLMTWDQISELYSKGIIFGSHTSNHKPLTALSAEQLTCQYLNSLNALKDHLGTQINSIAYPYGDYDFVVRHLAGACGFTFGLTCEEGKWNKFTELLEIPRIEISGLDSLTEFIRKIEKTPVYP